MLLKMIYKLFLNYLFQILNGLYKESTKNISHLCLKVPNTYIVKVSYILKNNILLRFDQLIEIAVIDNPSKSSRFILNFLLLSLKYNNRITISVISNSLKQIFSLTMLYKSAGWLEREVSESYGIRFKNNMDLRRLLTDYGFKGYPLRKDFPLTGFIEIYYNDETKRLKYEPVILAQEYRKFNFRNPWEKSVV